MRIFKFGGASVKDAEGVRNVAEVLRRQGFAHTIVVVSAMGKTTNAMEKVVEAYLADTGDSDAALAEVRGYHAEILSELFPDPAHSVHESVRRLFEEVQGFMAWNKSPNYNFVYDQVVGYGELLSTRIVSAYLQEAGIPNTWLDVRELIQTNGNYREAEIEWELTDESLAGVDWGKGLHITQGFLGSDSNNFTTTLGREGSDYTGAILAYALDAESLTIWKDVPGVLNADPRKFGETQLLRKISYGEAIELAFYGASVIHPKTLQPLQRKQIPLHVRSFLDPESPGTVVDQGLAIEPKVPCYIVKEGMTLIRLYSKDFSFIGEKNISELFHILHQHRLKVDLIQNSAISFSVCCKDTYGGLSRAMDALQESFRTEVLEGASLLTIRHFEEESARKLLNGRPVWVEQRTAETLQWVVGPIVG